jgi:hypothetical protein
MTDDATDPRLDAERPYLLILLGALGLLGCASLVVGTLVAPYFVPGHDWVADSISDLAAGNSQIIMDVALYGFAGGLLAIALAASHAHLGGTFWSVGVVSLAALAVLVTIIAARDEYGDLDTGGVVVHVYLVYGLGALFLAVPFALHRIGRSHPQARRLLFGLGIAWGVGAPIFFFLPTWVDGLYERALGVIAGTMVVVLAWTFLSRGFAALRRH